MLDNTLLKSILNKDLKYINYNIESKIDKNLDGLINYLDLTSLNDLDSEITISNLYKRALDLMHDKTKVASLCVYPLYVSVCNQLKLSHKPITLTTVDTSFPHGKLPLRISCCGIKNSIIEGADEIDIVIDRGNIITKNWQGIFNEVCAKRKAINEAQLERRVDCKVIMKTIISVGDLNDPLDAYIASRIAILGGTDFVKTSTGKEPKSTTPEMALAILEAIKDHYNETQQTIGFKVAGGIKTVDQALYYRSLVEQLLGPEWMNPHKFRIGASSLLDDILTHISRENYS